MIITKLTARLEQMMVIYLGLCMLAGTTMLAGLGAKAVYYVLNDRVTPAPFHSGPMA